MVCTRGLVGKPVDLLPSNMTVEFGAGDAFALR